MPDWEPSICQEVLAPRHVTNIRFPDDDLMLLSLVAIELRLDFGTLMNLISEMSRDVDLVYGFRV